MVKFVLSPRENKHEVLVDESSQGVTSTEILADNEDRPSHNENGAVKQFTAKTEARMAKI